MADTKISLLTSAGALAGTEPLPIVQGGVTKKTTVQDVANLKATPSLQQVTTVNNTTTVGIAVDNGAGESIAIKHDTIDITNTLGGLASITSTILTTPTEFRIPNKATSPQTFAMMSDIIAGSGDVVGPASAVNNNIALYDNTTGKLIKDGGYSVSTSTADIASSVKVPVWTAIVTYVTGLGYLLESTAASTYQAILTAANMHTFVDSLNTMTTPADADRLLIVDNSASLAKKITWANIKATLKTYFDSLTTTLTNKRITARAGTVVTDATPTINTDNVDYYSITALAAAITSFTTNLSGTPTIGQTLWISIKDDGTARAITWGASFESSTITLPTTTVISTRLDVAFIWNELTSVWRCVGVA
jgi:hypothetical protein